jgi:hypothetical protein
LVTAIVRVDFVGPSKQVLNQQRANALRQTAAYLRVRRKLVNEFSHLRLKFVHGFDGKSTTNVCEQHGCHFGKQKKMYCDFTAVSDIHAHKNN